MQVSGFIRGELMKWMQVSDLLKGEGVERQAESGEMSMVRGQRQRKRLIPKWWNAKMAEVTKWWRCQNGILHVVAAGN